MVGSESADGAFTSSFSVSGISIDPSVSGPRNPIKTFPLEAYLSCSRRSGEVPRTTILCGFGIIHKGLREISNSMNS